MNSHVTRVVKGPASSRHFSYHFSALPASHNTLTLIAMLTPFLVAALAACALAATPLTITGPFVDGSDSAAATTISFALLATDAESRATYVATTAFSPGDPPTTSESLPGSCTAIESHIHPSHLHRGVQQHLGSRDIHRPLHWVRGGWLDVLLGSKWRANGHHHLGPHSYDVQRPRRHLHFGQ